MFFESGWTQGPCNRLEVIDALIACSHSLLASVSFRQLFEDSYRKDLTDASEKGWGSSLVGSIVSGVQHLLWAPSHSSDFPYFTLEVTLSLMGKEVNEWKEEGATLGNTLSEMSDPKQRQKALSHVMHKRWALQTIVESCLAPVTKHCQPIAVGWWRLFFHRYFSYIPPSSQWPVGGFFAQYFLEAMGVSVSRLQERLDFLKDFHQVESSKNPQSTDAYLQSLYSDMKTWLQVDINSPQLSPSSLLQLPQIQNRVYLQQLIELDESQLRNTLHFSFDYEAIETNLRTLCESMDTTVDRNATDPLAYWQSSTLGQPTPTYTDPGAPGVDIYPDPGHKKLDVEDPLPPSNLKIEVPMVQPSQLQTDQLKEQLKTDLDTFTNSKAISHRNETCL